MKHATPLAFLALALALGLPGVSTAADALYEVTIQNRARSTLTSVVWATHGPQGRMFQKGRKASRGVAELAKDGVTGIVRKELRARQNRPRGVHSIGETNFVGAGRKISFRVRADSIRNRLSWATMAVCSNDTFAGQDSWRLPSRVGQSKSANIRALDAGAELNTEAAADVPCLGAHGTGPAENKRIRFSDAIRGDADLDPKRGWGRFIARITVKRVR